MSPASVSGRPRLMTNMHECVLTNGSRHDFWKVKPCQIHVEMRQTEFEEDLSNHKGLNMRVQFGKSHEFCNVQTDLHESQHVGVPIPARVAGGKIKDIRDYSVHTPP